MLLHDKTIEEFSYNPDNLSKGSHKKIYYKCDYCNKEQITSYKDYLKNRQKLEKDACWDCRHLKTKDILLIKEGITNVGQRISVKEKIKEVNTKKNQENPNRKKQIAEKVKRSHLEKYGEFYTKTDEFKNRFKKTCLKKYGADNPSKVEKVKEKRKKTNLEKWGNEYFLGSEKGKEIVRQGVLKKHGVDNPFQSEEVKRKIVETHLEKYGVEHLNKIPEEAKRRSEKCLETKKEKGLLKTYDGKTIRELAQETGYSRSRFNALVNLYGFDEACQMTPHISSLETKVEIMLSELGIFNIVRQFKVENRIADFYLPDHHLIIESCGIYYHSEFINDDKFYHFNKKKLYTDHGYNSLFFWEDEISDKSPIVKSIIANQCGLSHRVYARKCHTKEISRQEGKKFLEDNHLMGAGAGRCFALVNNNEIQTIMRVKSLGNNSSEYEISRFCHKLNTTVVGGFSKLLKYVINELTPSLVITYTDLRYGNGSYLKDLGFSSHMVYPSFNWTNGNDRMYRMKFPSNSGYSKGLVKIWDCGQKKHSLDVWVSPNG